MNDAAAVAVPETSKRPSATAYLHHASSPVFRKLFVRGLFDRRPPD
jgi:hypothetical protein